MPHIKINLFNVVMEFPLLNQRLIIVYIVQHTEQQEQRTLKSRQETITVIKILLWVINPLKKLMNIKAIFFPKKNH